MVKNTFINPKTGRISITEVFGENVAILLSDKISTVYHKFDSKSFILETGKLVTGKSYTKRIEIIADLLKKYLPEKYIEALAVLTKILGPENKEETGMFAHFYWIMPIGKFIEKYGLDHFDISIKAIEEITKRNTGEYAIRPFAVKYPKKILEICKKWARSDNFHLRRLSSEGLRPKLPWAKKLDLWNNEPEEIFEILDILKEDGVKFVKKSVANHLRDWIKINPLKTTNLINSWKKSSNINTLWILKYATR